jgi:hypothetical protein
MSALTSEIRAARVALFCLGKFNPPLHELFNSVRAIRNNKSYDLFFTETGSAYKGVTDMKLKAVILIEDSRDASLRQIRIGIGFFFLCNDRYGSKICRLNRETQSCNAASQYQKIGGNFHNQFSCECVSECQI